MTPIAYKDGVIAYDSRVTRGDSITCDDYEKCAERKGVKFLCSGTVSDHRRLIDFYFDAHSEGEIDAVAIVLNNGTLMFVAVDEKTETWMSLIMIDRPHAIGSGTLYVFAAIDMSATAVQTVEMAAKRDANTGGTIRSVIVNEGIDDAKAISSIVIA